MGEIEKDKRQYKPLDYAESCVDYVKSGQPFGEVLAFFFGNAPKVVRRTPQQGAGQHGDAADEQGDDGLYVKPFGGSRDDGKLRPCQSDYKSKQTDLRKPEGKGFERLLLRLLQSMLRHGFLRGLSGMTGWKPRQAPQTWPILQGCRNLSDKR